MRHLLLLSLALGLVACGGQAAPPAPTIAPVVKATIPIVPPATGGAGQTGGPPGTETFPVPSSRHLQPPIAYAQTPPVGGDHASGWQNCGYYEAPVPNETAVHSLEHGAVWITYRPDLPPDQVGPLRELARRGTHILVSPFPGLPTPVVASAWGRQIRLESAADPRLDEFIRAFQNGPQTPEPGAPCNGGVGSPAR